MGDDYLAKTVEVGRRQIPAAAKVNSQQQVPKFRVAKALFWGLGSDYHEGGGTRSCGWLVAATVWRWIA